MGTPGDVEPFLELAVALRDRGHRPAVLAHEYFQPWIQRHGLELIPIGSAAEFELLLNDRNLWNVAKAHRVFGRKLVIPSMARIFQAIQAESQREPVMIVSQTLAVGARLASEKLHLPMVMVHRQPAVLRSLHDSPHLPGTWMGTSAPAWARKLQFRIIDLALDRVLAGPLNAYRQELGLAPVHRVMDRWINQQSTLIGTWPQWFAPIQPDWPAGLTLVGFDLQERGEQPADPQVQAFLEDGSPPIAFTFGSGMRHGQQMYQACADICQRLGRRGIIATRYVQQVPQDLPPTILHSNYAPFAQLLPRCAALVHHGGIGTVGHALAAGIPQLIVSGLVFDTIDNGNRIAALGCGDRISYKQFTANRVAPILKKLIDSREVRSHCQQIRLRINGPETMDAICNLVEDAAKDR